MILNVRRFDEHQAQGSVVLRIPTLVRAADLDLRDVPKLILKIAARPRVGVPQDRTLYTRIVQHV